MDAHPLALLHSGQLHKVWFSHAAIGHAAIGQYMFVNRVAMIAGIEGKPQVRIMSIVVHWESSCTTFVTCDLLLDGILEATAQLVTGISNKRLIQMSP